MVSHILYLLYFYFIFLCCIFSHSLVYYLLFLIFFLLFLLGVLLLGHCNKHLFYSILQKYGKAVHQRPKNHLWRLTPHHKMTRLCIHRGAGHFLRS